MKLVICDLCSTTVSAHMLERHVDSPRCTAGQLAIAKRYRGLHPVELKWQAKSDRVAKALRLFAIAAELHPTRARRLGPIDSERVRGGGPGNEVWTSFEGVALALLIEHAAKVLAVSYPEAARRLHERQDLVAPFGAARLLGEEDGVLLAMLKPIDWIVGSDGKRRPRRPVDMLPIQRRALKL